MYSDMAGAHVRALLEQGELVGRRRRDVRACPVAAVLHATGGCHHPLNLVHRLRDSIGTALQQVLAGCQISRVQVKCSALHGLAVPSAKTSNQCNY